MGHRGMGTGGLGDGRGREGGRPGGAYGSGDGEIEQLKKGDLYFIQLLDYTSKSPMRPDPIVIH